MQPINIHESKAGKPMVKAKSPQPDELLAKRRLGFMTGVVDIPDNFDQMNRAEIERLFGASDR